MHVSIDTYSHCVYSTCHAGETARHIQEYCLLAFAKTAVRKKTKTENYPVYISKSFQKFLQQWNVNHSNGILCNPQGHAILGHAHFT